MLEYSRVENRTRCEMPYLYKFHTSHYYYIIRSIFNKKPSNIPSVAFRLYEISSLHRETFRRHPQTYHQIRSSSVVTRCRFKGHGPRKGCCLTCWTGHHGHLLSRPWWCKLLTRESFFFVFHLWPRTTSSSWLGNGRCQLMSGPDETKAKRVQNLVEGLKLLMVVSVGHATNQNWHNYYWAILVRIPLRRCRVIIGYVERRSENVATVWLLPLSASQPPNCSFHRWWKNEFSGLVI